MARNYPDCDWQLSSAFLNGSADYLNITPDEAEDLFLEVYGPCEYLVFNYITDVFVYTLIACYCAIMPIGFFGNLAVIFTVLSVDELKNVVNLFLVALACSDLLLTVTLPWTLLHNISYDFNYGNALCKIVPPIQGTAVMSAIVTMVIIAMERYRAVVQPFRSRILNTPLRIKLCIAVIWILSFCFQIPQPIVLEVITYQDTVVIVPLFVSYNVTINYCMESWPAEQAKAYSYAILTIFYIIPLVTLALLYFRIGYFMWKRRPIAAVSNNEVRIYRRKRRLVIFLVVLVAVFAILWGPYFVIQCTQGYLKEDYNPLVPAYLQMMGHSNVAFDPILYALFHQKIRKHMLIYFRRAKSFCCCSETIPQRTCRVGVMGQVNIGHESEIDNSSSRRANEEDIELNHIDPEFETSPPSSSHHNSSRISYQDLVSRLSDIQKRNESLVAVSEDSGCNSEVPEIINENLTEITLSVSNLRGEDSLQVESQPTIHICTSEEEGHSVETR